MDREPARLANHIKRTVAGPMWHGQALNEPEHSAYFLGPTLHYSAERWWATLGWRHQLPLTGGIFARVRSRP